MEVVGEDQALQAVLGRGDFDGIDNEALDFSQLQQYINEDNENTIYFHEALVGSELKLSESSKPTNPFHCETTTTSGTTEQSYSPYNSSNTTGIYCDRATASKATDINTHSHPTVTVPSIAVSSQPHHLPDSPPDSGSEPPFSPPHEDPKLIHGRTGQLEKMQSQTENLKHHYITYGNTQPLKHLPEPGLTVTPPHQHSPHQAHSGNHPLLTHNQPPPGGQGLTQLSPMSVVPNVPPQTLPSLVNSTHLGSLFGSTEDYICESLDNPQNNPSKKRKLSDSSKNVVVSNILNGIVHVKQEPGSDPLKPGGMFTDLGGLSPEPATTSSVLPTSDEDYGFDFGGSETSGMFLDSTYQCIRFQAFQQNSWHILLDRNLKELHPPNYRVDADKGFNFSNADDAFVCQKKNHFQVTVHVQPTGEYQFVKTPEGVKQIDNFYLHFHGVKVESPSQTIKVEQSQSDRSKKPFYPVLIELAPEQVTKTTVGRLHFSETTSNNMRKKGKPNPDQRYFYLVVSLCAHVDDQSYQIIAHASERIIVRASNPGQFENDLELCWQKGHLADSIYHAGRVGINTDRPEESLVVHGNIKLTGHIVQPSDTRVKKSIEELDTRLQLQNVANMRIVKYSYLPEFGKQVGLTDEDLSGTGVLAQEIQQILPEAVREIGKVVLSDGREVEHFLVVNKERIFMENVGAVKELCKVTDKLETRIDELERMNKKLTRLKRIDSIKSTSSGSTVTSRCSSVTNSKKKYYRHQCHRQKHQSLFCTNHIVQATILVLLLLMSFCLAAVATLYVLEWHKRQEFQPSAILMSLNKENQNIYNNYTTSTRNLYSSSLQRASPINVSSFNNIASAITEPVSQFGTPSSESTIEQSTIDYLRDPTRKILPKTIGVPSSCLDSTSCTVMCCDSNSDYTHQGEFRSHPINTVSDVGRGIDQTSSLRRVNVSDEHVTEEYDISMKTDKINETIHHKENDDYSPTLLENEDDLGMEIIEDNNAMSESQTSESVRRARQTELVHTIRRRDVETKSDIDKDLSEMMISLNLLELNVTLDNNFCEAITKANKPIHYTCRIHLSKYMNLENVTLQFRMQQTSIVAKCQTNEPYVDCSIPTQNSVYSFTNRASLIEHQNPSWSLPIGLYLRSSYVFRILSSDSNTQMLCSLPSEDMGHTFIEYHLIFQRMCDK